MKSYIKDISIFLPPSSLDNNTLVKEGCKWTAEQIFNKIGVRNRHIVNSDESSLTIALKASEKILYNNPTIKENLDYILYSTLCHEHFMLNSAAVIQKCLGIHNCCATLDFKLPCSGYISLLSIANALITSGQANNVLVVTSDTYSRVIKKDDYGTRSIFGDAATATLVAKDGWLEIGKCIFDTDGDGSLKHIVRTNCVNKFSMPFWETYNDIENCSSEYFYMFGEEIFGFVAEKVPVFYKEILTANNIVDDDNLVLFHQANKYMLNYLRKVLKIPINNFYIDMENLGNTSTSSIPIALSKIKKLQPLNKTIICCAFGGGYCCSGTVLKLL